MRKEFERVAPESVGIPSESIEKLLDRFEEGWTEPHGLMIMRDGKVFAEGWWAPYAPGICHGLQSHTKTYAATAVGIAVTEGILRLDERVIDIFPDRAPKDPSENLKLLTVRDVLCMGCGMEKMPFNGVDWIDQFLATPVVHKPGTAFMYNSTGSTLLGAMVREKTGLGLIDYLTPRLFDKIGIDPKNLKCICMEDGMEMGGGGLYATTEDNLRLMKVYADGGVWEGERILSEEYVKLATSLQNESATERAVNPPAEDNFVGYGFQIWMCRPEGVYRADGAMGQFTIVFPKYNMILAITENASGSTGGVMPQKALDTIWEWYYSLPAPDAGPLPENAEAAEHLKRRMTMLALPAPRRSPISPLQECAAGDYEVTEGYLSFKQSNFFIRDARTDGFTKLNIAFDCHGVTFTGTDPDGNVKTLVAAMDGSRKENTVDGLATISLTSADWVEENLLRVTARFVETCNEQFMDFTFDGDALKVEIYNNHAFSMNHKDVVTLRKA
ncbi:MAG: serine hydrolase [Lachnospiraceae bacterium]|nr:serine hydrolase [Lachnospiraceae bacterium]